MNFKNKKLFSLILTLVMLLGIFVGPLQDIAVASEPDSVNLTILGTTDVHGNIFWNYEDNKELGEEISLKDIAFAMGSAFVIVAISTHLASFLGSVIPKGNFGLELLNGLFGNKYLIITTLTVILATYIPNFFGNIHGASELGTFLIYIFFVVIGVPASIQLIVTKSPLLLVFCKFY